MKKVARYPEKKFSKEGGRCFLIELFGHYGSELCDGANWNAAFCPLSSHPSKEASEREKSAP